MANKLCILVCENLKRELASVIESEGLGDVRDLIFPSRCGQPPVDWQVLQELAAPLQNTCDRFYLLGGFCIGDIGKPKWRQRRWRVRRLGECSEFLVAQTLAEHYRRQRAYLVAPGWLERWREFVQDRDFDRPAAHRFFAKSNDRVVLLNTGVMPGVHAPLQEFADFIGMPYESVPVGIDFFRLLIMSAVLEWRLDNERRRARSALADKNREVADHTMAFDLVTRLAAARTERKAIQDILELFTMLFAPEKLFYVPLYGTRHGNIISRPEYYPVSEELLGRLINTQKEYELNPSGDGFLMTLSHRREPIGVIEIEGVALPEYMNRYLNLALTLSKVCGLAISNARAYEKMKQPQTGSEKS